MDSPRLYLGWRDLSGVQVFRVIGGKFLSLPARLPEGASAALPFDWGCDDAHQRALSWALCADLLADFACVRVAYLPLSKRLSDLTEAGIPWIFEERFLRSLITPCLKKAVHGFPIGVWSRAINGESAASVLRSR